MSLARTVASLACIVLETQVSWCWAVASVLLVLPWVVGEDFLREKSSSVNINLLLDNSLVSKCTLVHVG